MKLKHLLLILILCVGAVLSAVTVAQDAPEATAEATVEAPPPVEEPPVEATEEPTVVPPVEEPPVVEITEEPPVVEITEEPPVVEVTEEPTETAPPPVIIAPEPPIGLLFADNFESGDYTPWLAGIGWVALPGQMQVIDSSEPLTLVNGIYFNAVAMARLQFTSGSGQVSIRSSDPLGYTAAVDTEGNVTLSRAGVPVGSAVVALSGPWTDIRLSAIGSVVRVAVNGVEVIVWNDDAPLPPGSVTISASFAPRTDPNAPSDTLTVEDFALFVPVEELPPPVVEEPPVVEVTEEPEVEATEEPTEIPVVEVTEEPTDSSVESGISAAVEPPTLKAPADGADVNTPRPVLSWNKVNGANGYRVDINTAEDFSGTDILVDKVVTTLSLSLTAANLPTPLGQGQYFWRVQAREASSGDWSGESVVRDFIVDLAKTPNNNIYTTTTTFRPTFSWASAGVPNPQYIVQVDDDDDFSSPVYELATPISGLSHQIPVANALPWGNYFWRVIVNSQTPNPALGIGNAFTVSPAAARITLIAPANALVTYQNTWGFDWNPVPLTALGGPFQYQIQIHTANKFNVPTLIDTIVGTDSYDHAALPDGKYWWRVRPVNAFSVGNWSAVWNFTIDRMAKPMRPLTCVTTPRPPFVWDRVPGATKYRLLVDQLADNFASPILDVERTTLSYTPTAAQALPLGIYVWRVDFELASNPGNWVQAPAQAVAQFCVTPTPLKAPTLVSPANNAFISDSTLPPLDWNDVVDPSANPVTYRLQVARNASFSAAAIVLDQNNIAVSNLDSALSPGDGVYWWRVKTVNYLGAESTAWSAVRKFTLDTIPPGVVPATSAPTCGSATTNNRPIFKWGAVPTATRYQIQVDTHNPLTSTLTILTAARQYQPPAQLLYTTWHWRVRGVDAAGNQGPWSTICNVIVNSAANIAPVPNRFTDNTPTLTWTPISWATSYTLEVYRSPTVSAANLVYSNSAIPGAATSQEVTPALDNGTYYWRVRAVGTGGPGAWSGPGLGIFQVEAP